MKYAIVGVELLARWAISCALEKCHGTTLVSYNEVLWKEVFEAPCGDPWSSIMPVPGSIGLCEPQGDDPIFTGQVE